MEGDSKEEQSLREKERKSQARNEEELKENQEEKRIEVRNDVPSKSGPSWSDGGQERGWLRRARGASVSVLSRQLRGLFPKAYF